jgi:hypothetical protein
MSSELDGMTLLLHLLFELHVPSESPAVRLVGHDWCALCLRPVCY